MGDKSGIGKGRSRTGVGKAARQVRGKGPKRDPAKDRFWRQTFRQFERAGLTVRTFCQEHEIAEHQFYAWRREIQRRDQEQRGRVKSKPIRNAKPGNAENARSLVLSPKGKSQQGSARPIFAPVTIIDDVSQAEPIEIVLDGITVRIPATASRESLETVLSAIETVGQSEC